MQIKVSEGNYTSRNQNSKELSMTTSTFPIELPPEDIQQCILFVRGEKVMLDAQLAILYGV